MLVDEALDMRGEGGDDTGGVDIGREMPWITDTGGTEEFVPSFSLIGMPRTAKIATVCHDTDGGKEYLTKGKVSGGSGAQQEGNDSCVDEQRSMELTEYICWHNQVKAMTVRCPYGCRDGVCLQRGVRATAPSTRPPRRLLESSVKRK